MPISPADIKLLVEGAIALTKAIMELGGHADPKEFTEELQQLVSDWKNDVLQVDVIAMRQRAELNAAVPKREDGGHSDSGDAN